MTTSARNSCIQLACKKSKSLTFAILIVCICFSLLSSPSQAQISGRSPGWVVISVDAYRSLRAKAYPLEHEPPGSPVPATLTRVDYELHVDGELATGHAALTVDVLRDGWVRVPIPPGLLVREAKLDGKLVALVPAEGTKSAAQPTALLTRMGRSVLSLDIALPVTSAAGQESLALPSTPSGITHATVQLARHGLDVQVKGGLLLAKSDTDAQSNWVAYGRGDEPLSFIWRRKTEDHHVTLPLRMRGSLTEFLGLGEEATSISAEVNLEVTQGAVREMRIHVPDKVIVNQVLGAMVADWQASKGELAISFLEPVEKQARFVIAAESRSPRDGRINVPLLRLLQTERDTGGVAVEVLGAGEITESKSTGLENADASDLGEFVAGRESPSLVAFKFRSGNGKAERSLSVNVARYTPQAVLVANIDEARYQVLASKDGKNLVQARYAVHNNQRNFLKITLPAGATLWSASLSGKPVRPGQAPDGGVLLPLEKTRAGEDAASFAVEIVYLDRATAWTDKGNAKVPLPALDLPVSRTGLVIFYPPLFKLTPQQGAFRTETYQEPSAAVLNGSLSIVAGIAGETGVATAGPTQFLNRKDDTAAQAANQAVLDQFRSKSSGKIAGILPIHVSFPSVGPSIYMVSELTAENQAPVVEIGYQHEKKAGGK